MIFLQYHFLFQGIRYAPQKVPWEWASHFMKFHRFLILGSIDFRIDFIEKIENLLTTKIRPILDLYIG